MEICIFGQPLEESKNVDWHCAGLVFFKNFKDGFPQFPSAELTWDKRHIPRNTEVAPGVKGRRAIPQCKRWLLSQLAFRSQAANYIIFYQCLPDLANLWANLIKDHQSQSMSLEDHHWLGNHWEVQSPKIIQNLSLLQLCYMWNSEKRLVLFCFNCLGRATLLFIHNVPIKAVHKWSQIPCSNSTLILIHIPWGDITLDISRLYLSLKLQPWIHWHSATFQNTSKH